MSKRPESVRLKDFTEVDYKMLEELSRLTGESTFTKAIKRACHQYLQLIQDHNNLRIEHIDLTSRYDKLISLMHQKRRVDSELNSLLVDE